MEKIRTGRCEYEGLCDKCETETNTKLFYMQGYGEVWLCKACAMKVHGFW